MHLVKNLKPKSGLITVKIAIKLMNQFIRHLYLDMMKFVKY